MGNNKANIILDASKIDLFETCPKRYFFRHIRNKTLPVLYRSKSLDLGGLAHEGLAVYYQLLAEGLHFADRVQRCLMKIRAISCDVTQSNSEPEEVETLLRAIEENLDFWRAEDENNIEVLAVEQSFAYTLYEDDDVRILLSGKIDLLTNYRGLGRGADYSNLPFDHKTFSRDSVLYRKSNQFINYSSAVSSNYIVINRIGLQKSLRPDERFKRVTLSYDPIYIQDWKDNLVKEILNEYLICVAEQSWPEKPTSCNKFNRLCEYYDVCDSSGQDSKDRKLETDYVDAEEWDVTKGLRVE